MAKKNYRILHRRVLTRKIATLSEALSERLAAPAPVGRDLEMHLLAIEGQRTLLGELQLELETIDTD